MMHDCVFGTVAHTRELFIAQTDRCETLFNRGVLQRYVPSLTELRCTRDALELVHSGRAIAQTAFWHDRWSPAYPREGHTRCGVCAMLQAPLLAAAAARMGRKLVWKAHIRLWQREGDFGEYALVERTAVLFD
jgi:hypothetical protein